MTILTSLKELLKKMGGTSKKSANTISEVIDEITNAYEGGGGGGGTETFWIDLAFDAEYEMYVTNKTWKEIHDAYIAGKRCVMKYEGSSQEIEMSYLEVTYFRASETESSYITGTEYWQFEAQSETGYPMGNI